MGSASIAELGGDRVSQAVNYRQKLARLEAGLGIGALTECVAGSTRLNRTGEQVAGELRLLLRALSALEQPPSYPSRWAIGAGDAWLQSVIVPALAAMPTNPTVVWDVYNLRSSEIVRGLKEGRLHFGFLRAADLRSENRIAIQRTYSGTGLELLVGHAATAPLTMRELLGWLVKSDRRFVQQGSTWRPLRQQLTSMASWSLYMSRREPEVTCETHIQAASAAAQSGSWCIVPTTIAELFVAPELRRVPILPAAPADDMVLAVNTRNNDRLPNIADVTRSLAGAIDKSMTRTVRGARSR